MNSEINSLPNQIYFDQPPFSHQIHGKILCVKSASFLSFITLKTSLWIEKT